jgi:ferrous iron transport protein B
VVAVNMVDLAEKSGVNVDCARLTELLGCPVVACCARSGLGVDDVRIGMRSARIPTPHAPVPGDADQLRQWSEEIFCRAVREPEAGSAGARALDPGSTLTDRIDRAVLHPVLGLGLFALVMTGLFWAIFSVAQYPMGWIEEIFGFLGGVVSSVMPAGVLQDLMSNGVVAGIGSTLVFLPQICLLVFLIALLEDTGYLARGAFVVDRLLRPFGLPGHSFVPLLSSHACALPGITACRAIPDPRERLATILVAPFMSCSARIPVYVLLCTLLFRDSPLKQSIAMVGCYALGIVAGVVSALLARRTLLRGTSRPMALELPTYKRPSLRTAALTTIDRAKMFLKNAGTMILMISIVLWWLGSYPHAAPPPEAVALREQAALVETSDADRAEALSAEADALEARHAQPLSFLGRMGRTVQPVFEPLGYDWQLSIGVLASFAAREVFVTTMAVIVSGNDAAAEEEGFFDTIATAKRDDGITPIFTPAVSWSLLVYYVLAMQCLPTLAVTAKESGGAKWALLQFVWMSGVAYAAALVVYQALRLSGVT